MKYTIETTFDDSITFVESMKDAKEHVRISARNSNRLKTEYIIKPIH
jgi:hypothetical protein